MSSRAPIGYLAFTTRPTAINQGFAGIVKRQISTSYAWGWCQANMDLILGSANGSTFLEISKGVFRKLPMLAPPEPILDAYSAVVDDPVERIRLLSVEAETLAALRDTLLPKLISGELRIADAEALVEAA